MSSEQSMEYAPADENYYSLMRLLFDKKWEEAFELINNNKEVATMVDRNRGTALHKACYSGAPLQVIDLLIRLNSLATKAKDDHGTLPLHRLAFGGADPEEVHRVLDPKVVRRVLEANASAAKVQNNWGWLPLHFAACNKRSPAKAFEILLSAYREGARVGDMVLPLHLACCCLLQHDDLCRILSCLIEANPDAVSTADNFGRCPFHCMMEAMVGQPTLAINPESVKGFKMVLDETLNVASTPRPFFNGGLPLHYLLNNPPSTENCYRLWSEMITFLFKAYPGALNFADNDGQHPLHVACRKLPLHCTDVLALLVNANPAVLIVVDNEGKTPFDCARERDNASEFDASEFITALFAKTPNGILLKKMEHSCAMNQRVSVAYAMAMKGLRAERKFNQCLSEKITALEAAKETKRRFSF